MTIKNFKEIIDDRGYQVDRKDREIFERNFTKSLFGTNITTWKRGSSDVIEFVLYDSNDNQLPQGETGVMVKYIDYDTAVNSGVFTTTDVLQNKTNGASEYFIDTEKLIRDAGYSNGIFKTQITLLNRRAASEVGNFDKLWIHEISPSRTEIRVLPVNSDTDGTILYDLNERYNIFVNNGNFRDDTVAFIQSYIEKVNVQTVLENFVKIRGRVSSGQTYINLIKKEFKVHDFEGFISKIREKLIESTKCFVENREYNINSNRYSEPLFTAPQLNLSADDIINTIGNILTDIIDFYLPKRNIQEKHVITKEEQETFDKLDKLLKTSTSDSIYDSTLPPSVDAPIYGCTNPDAENYNPSAQIDDGSCIYKYIDDSTDDVIPQIDDGRRETGYIDEDGTRVDRDSERAGEHARLITPDTPRTDVDYTDRRGTGVGETSTVGTIVRSGEHVGSREVDETLTTFPTPSNTRRTTTNTPILDPLPVETSRSAIIPTTRVDTSIDGGARETTTRSTTSTRLTGRTSEITRTSTRTTRGSSTTDGVRTTTGTTTKTIGGVTNGITIVKDEEVR